MSVYATMICERLAASGHLGEFDPRHIEAYMRIEHSTLDGLSAEQFNAEVDIARYCVVDGGVEAAEALALSFGLPANARKALNIPSRQLPDGRFTTGWRD